MPLLSINTGTGPNSYDGDSLRTAFTKVNQNLRFLENQYIQAGVASVNGQAGIVVLTATDITSALGFAPYPDTNPTQYLTYDYLSVDGYTITNFVTVSYLATYLNSGKYITQDTLPSAISTSLAITGVVTTSSLETVLAAKNYASNDELNQQIAYLQGQILPYNTLTNYVTFAQLAIYDFNISRLVASNNTFSSVIINSNTFTGIIDGNEIIQSVTEFNVNETFSIKTKTYLDTTSTLQSNRLRFSAKDTVLTVYDRGYLENVLDETRVSADFNFTYDGLEFNRFDVWRPNTRKTTKQIMPFSINAKRPKSPRSIGIPGQIYVPNQYEILKDPYIYFCIDQSYGDISPDGSTNTFHVNWVRVPIEWRNPANPFNRIYDYAADGNIPDQPPSVAATSIILYPNENRDFTLTKNQTYSTSTQTMICMHLRWTGSGHTGTNYRIVNENGVVVPLPSGLSLSSLSIPAQEALFGEAIRIWPSGNEIPTADIFYKGVTLHLSGTPTTSTTKTRFFVEAVDPNNPSQTPGEGKFRMDFRLKIVD